MSNATLLKSVAVSQLVVTPLDLPKVKIPTLDLSTNTRIESQTVYQNNLAAAMHTLDTVRALDCSRVDPENQIEVLTKFNATARGHLDGATGSRKKGILMATSESEVGKGIIERYFTGSKRITHGSILFSECRKMFSIPGLTYQVSPDSAPGLGDCHGMISETLYKLIQAEYWMPDNTGIQFRFGVRDKWTAKGVVLPYPDSYLPAGCHLVLPDSSFKAACPELDVSQTDDCFFGILHTSKKRRFATSHQVLQCFTTPSAQGYLAGKCRESMGNLLELRNDHRCFAQSMLENIVYRDGMDSEELQQAVDDDDSMKLLHIAAKDKYAQLWGHHSLVTVLNRLFRRRCVDIATGKFLSATGLTATPLDNLKQGYVFSNSLPTGEYISFRYPVRHYGDIRLVKVVNPNNPLDVNGKVVDVNKRISTALKGGQSKLTAHQRLFVDRMWVGTFAINPAYALEVGMDFDGDMVAFMSASEHPLLTKEVKAWKPLPVIEKPAKKAHNKSVIEVAVDSMSNQVGILAALMSNCRLYNLTSEFAPLGEQIQLVVDSLKSDTGVDFGYIKKLSAKVRKLIDHDVDQGAIPWTQIYKDEDIFLNPNAIPTMADRHQHDTITQFFSIVSDMFVNGAENVKGLAEGETPFVALPNERFKFLYNDIVPRNGTIERAKKHHSAYVQQVMSVINAYPDKPSKGQEKMMMKLIATIQSEYVEMAEEWRQQFAPDVMDEIISAFWSILHKRGATSSPMIAMKMFAPELSLRLSTYRGTSFRLWKAEEIDKWQEFDNDIFTAWVSPNAQGDDCLWTRVDGKIVRLGRVITDGLTNGSCIPFPGMLLDVRVTSVCNKSGVVTYQAVEVCQCLES